MIIGNGSLAKILKDREGAIFFCSGVGNSQCRDDKEFEREIAAIKTISKVRNSFSLFYFSSIVADVTCSPYFNHKTRCEETVRQLFHNYNIVRLGNIWECTNKYTFINYIKANPEATVREDELRYMISASMLNMICQSLPLKGKNQISIFEELLTVDECLNRSHS